MTTLNTPPKTERKKELADIEQGSDLQYIFDSIDSEILRELEGMREKLLQAQDKNWLNGPLMTIAIPIALVGLMFLTVYLGGDQILVIVPLLLWLGWVVINGVGQKHNKDQYVLAYRNHIGRKLLQEEFGGMTIDQTYALSEGEFMQSGLFPKFRDWARFLKYKSVNLLHGTMDELPITVSEVHAYKEGGQSSTTIFLGLFYTIDAVQISKEWREHLAMLHNSDPQLEIAIVGERIYAAMHTDQKFLEPDPQNPVDDEVELERLDIEVRLLLNVVKRLGSFNNE